MGADTFVIKASLNQALFGFGDAVCVPVIEWIARNYLNPVWEEEFAPVMPSLHQRGPVNYRKAARRS
jgi:DNA (cytosine-5)-methyltransferase 1